MCKNKIKNQTPDSILLIIIFNVSFVKVLIIRWIVDIFVIFDLLQAIILSRK